MKILLIGEFSRLHNSLKEGLIKSGHQVKIISNGDSFKNFPTDYCTKPKFLESKLGNIPRQIIFRLTNFDLAKLEIGIRFYFHCYKLKNFDVVQLINERPIQTTAILEYFLLKKIIKNDKKTFLLCCGVDYMVMQYMLEKTAEYSIMNPYFESKIKLKNYDYMFKFTSKSHIKIHKFLYQNINGVIASDFDYVLATKNNPKFLGLIPNPVNTSKYFLLDNSVNEKVVIFLGINSSNYQTKGIFYFEKALEIIEKKYPNSVEIIIATSIPYSEYINLYNQAHILLDQVFSYDQGYNALEAMAKGKVVFTGAETEFTEYYNLKERVCINALPDVDYLVKELSFLIENPEEIIAIGTRARAFIEKEHDYVKIAEKYIEVWGK